MSSVSDEYPAHVAGNVAAWTEMAKEYVQPAEAAWASQQPYWGIWCIPDSEIGLLPDDLTGKAQRSLRSRAARHEPTPSPDCEP